MSSTIPVALVILSEPRPLEALESAFRRCAYVLIPLSLLLIKYFPDLGVAYVTWSGDKMWLGVASQKRGGPGVVCALAVFLIIWAFQRDWRAGALVKVKFHALADGLILVMAVFLLEDSVGLHCCKPCYEEL